MYRKQKVLKREVFLHSFYRELVLLYFPLKCYLSRTESFKVRGVSIIYSKDSMLVLMTDYEFLTQVFHFYLRLNSLLISAGYCYMRN